jgi:hypothetical protein
MKNELKVVLRSLQDMSNPLLEEVKNLPHLKLVERKERGEALEKKIEEILQVKGPLYDLEAALDEVRFIVRHASEGINKLARIA